MTELIIALDFPDKKEVETFLKKFPNESLYVKVGMELFYKEGPSIINFLKEQGHRIFLDLKLHDIPNTVKSAMRNLASLGVDMVNVHAAGGSKMMEAALEGLEEGTTSGDRPLLIAVTQLTSTTEEMMNEELRIHGSLQETVSGYAHLTKVSGLDGVVCSVHEVEQIRKVCGSEFATVTPGIRLASDNVDDQVRVATPSVARKAGSSYIVVGRSITNAENPYEIYQLIQQQLEGEKSMEKQIASHLLDIGAVFLQPNNPFTWSSGIKSPIYCDNRLTLSFPNVRKDIANGLATLIKENYPDVEVIAGTSTAGIPHAAWISEILNLPMCYVRSKAKEHGKGNQIEGSVKIGQRVVVVEDLISTGGSVLTCVEALHEAGCEVLGVAAIFSYELDKAENVFAEKEIKCVTLSDYTTLTEVAKEKGAISAEDVKKLAMWRKDPSDESWISA